MSEAQVDSRNTWMRSESKQSIASVSLKRAGKRVVAISARLVENDTWG